MGLKGTDGIYVPPNRRVRFKDDVGATDPVMDVVQEVERSHNELRKLRQAECFGLEQKEVDEAFRVMSAGHLSDLRAQVRPPADSDLPVLKKLFSKTKPGHREEFFSLRKVVESYSEFDGKLMQVVPNTADVLGLVEGSILKTPVEAAGRPKRFEVIQLLTDKTLVDLFEMSESFLQSMKRLAVVDTVKAAIKLQERVRTYDKYATALVSPGVYARSWKAARDRILLEAAKYPPRQTAVDALFVGDKVFVYAPDPKSTWSVFGPERCAHLVRAVHAMVLATSCESVTFAYGSELTILDIDVYDGEMVLCPVVRGHVGLQDRWEARNNGLVYKYLSPLRAQKLATMFEAVHTLYSDGQPTATGIKVSKTAMLVNAHVAGDEGLLTVGDDPVCFERMLGRDLWLARADGPQVVWNMREPVLGERVFLMAKKDGVPVVSDPVELLKFDSDVLMMTKTPFMAPGASGAAIVALSDFALLGSYGGDTLRAAIGSAFTPHMFVSLGPNLLSPRTALASQSDSVAGVLEKFQACGVSSLVSANIKSVVPFYSKAELVGYGVKSGSVVYTTEDFGEVSTTTVSNHVAGFEPHTSGLYCSGDAKYQTVPGYLVDRAPAYGEKVIVVGCDDQGPFYTMVGAKVASAGLLAGEFKLSGIYYEGLPVVGALIIAQADGAVLGVFHREEQSVRGRIYGVCKLLPPKEAESQTPYEGFTEAVSSVLPCVKVQVWPDSSVQEFAEVAKFGFGEREDSSLDRLAAVGRNVLGLKVSLLLMERGFPVEDWAAVQGGVLSDEVISGKFLALGLQKVFSGGPDCADKTRAKFMFAIIGAVYRYEPVAVFDALVEQIKVFDVT